MDDPCPGQPLPFHLVGNRVDWLSFDATNLETGTESWRLAQCGSRNTDEWRPAAEPRVRRMSVTGSLGASSDVGAAHPARPCSRRAGT